MTVYTLTRQSCCMADQPDALHVTDVALGEMQLSLSQIVYRQLTSLGV